MNTQTIEKRRNQLKKISGAGLLLLALLCLATLLLVLRFSTRQVSLKAGDIFPYDIKAPYSGTDSFLTDKARQQARESAAVVYVTGAALVQEREAAIETWFTRFTGWLGDMYDIWAEDAETLEDKYLFRGLTAKWKEIYSETEMAQSLVKRGISEEITVTVAYLILDKYLPANMAHTIGEAVDAADFKKAFTDIVYPVLEAGVDEAGLTKAQTSAKTAIKKRTLLSALKTEVAGKLIDKYLLTTITVDEVATEENRRLAAATVADVRVTRGEVLFAKDAAVTAEDITHLTSLGLLKGAGEASAFSFPALLIYAVLCVLTVGLWLILFEKKLILKPRSMAVLTLTYALSALLAFAFSYFKAEAAPVLFALLCTAEEGKKEHTAGALIFSALLLPVLLDTDAPFGTEGLITAVSLLIGGFCACAFLFTAKGHKPNLLTAGLVGGTVIGIARLCPLLWEKASTPLLIMGFGFPFLGGLLAAVLAVVARPLLKKIGESASQNR